MWRYKLLLFIVFNPLVIYTLWQSLHAFELRYFLLKIGVYPLSLGIPGTTIRARLGMLNLRVHNTIELVLLDYQISI